MSTSIDIASFRFVQGQELRAPNYPSPPTTHWRALPRPYPGTEYPRKITREKPPLSQYGGILREGEDRAGASSRAERDASLAANFAPKTLKLSKYISASDNSAQPVTDTRMVRERGCRTLSLEISKTP